MTKAKTDIVLRKDLHWTQRPGGAEKLSKAVKQGWARKRKVLGGKKAARTRKMRTKLKALVTSEASEVVIPSGARIDVVTDEMVLGTLTQLQTRRAGQLAAMQTRRLLDGKVRNDDSTQPSLLFPPTGKDMGILTAFALHVAARERGAVLAIVKAHMPEQAFTALNERIASTVVRERGPLAVVPSFTFTWDKD